MASTRNPRSTTDDRISLLPNPILHHILSFLPTKEAARTSILSKQWQFLWTWLPNLDLDQTKISAEYASFEPIALQIMRSRRCSSITKFRLQCLFENDTDWESVSPCPILSEAVSRNVEELDFSMFGNGRGDMDSYPSLNLSIFSCETLVVLKLRFGFLVMLESSAMLPNVKVLRLGNVLFEANDSLENLLAGCPVLEDLFIETAYLDEDEDDAYSCDYRVSSRTLRNLILRDNDAFSGPRIYVDAPALESLTILAQIRNSEPTFGLHLQNMDNLERAEVTLANYDAAQVDWGEVMGIFRALYAVSYLELNCVTSCTGSEYHIASTLKFPRFGSLVELKLNGFCCFWPMLFHMLHECSVLQNLTYHAHYVIDSPCDEPQSWIPPERVPDCLLSHLTTFNYQCLAGTEPELQLIRYVMKNSKVLGNMTITYCSNLTDKQQLDALEEFFRSERGSASCLLHFSIFE